MELGEFGRRNLGRERGRREGKSRRGSDWEVRVRTRAQFEAAPCSTISFLLLSGLGDNGAGDARGRSAGGFSGNGVDDHCGAAIAENGVTVGTERHVGGDDRGMSGAVGANDQREVGNVAGGEPAVIVGRTVGIEVCTGGLEVGAFALSELMNMERVPARREILDVELDANAVRSFGERRGADHLILSVLDLDNDWFGRCWRSGAGHGCRCYRREEQAENC